MVLGEQSYLLVIISFDGNNGMKQECSLNEMDCCNLSIALNMDNLTFSDIVYDENFCFNKNSTNIEAVKRIEQFVSA